MTLKEHSLIAAIVALAAAVASPAFAQERSKQDLPANFTPPQIAASTGSVQSFIGAEAGYDTNLDNKVASRASRYEMLQAGLSGYYRASETEAYTASFRGRNYWYDSLDVIRRYDVDLALGSRYDISKDVALKAGTSWYRDAISINKIDVFKSYADLVKETDAYRLRLKVDSRTELSFRKDEQQGLLDPDVFSVIRSRAFDFTKNGATASVLLGRKEIVAPFLIGNFTSVDYIHQDPDPAINRTALEHWGIAGVRVTLDPAFSVDIGYRYNNRDFRDQLFTRFSSSMYDARFTWKASDALTVRGVIERQIKEPVTSFGLADDVKTYELAYDYKAGLWTFYGKAYLDQIRAIGDTFDYRKYNWALGVTYAVSKSTDLYVDYAGKYVTEQIGSESYERTRISTGVKAKF